MECPYFVLGGDFTRHPIHFIPIEVGPQSGEYEIEFTTLGPVMRGSLGRVMPPNEYHSHPWLGVGMLSYQRYYEDPDTGLWVSPPEDLRKGFQRVIRRMKKVLKRRPIGGGSWIGPQAWQWLQEGKVFMPEPPKRVYPDEGFYGDLPEKTGASEHTHPAIDAVAESLRSNADPTVTWRVFAERVLHSYHFLNSGRPACSRRLGLRIQALASEFLGRLYEVRREELFDYITAKRFWWGFVDGDPWVDFFYFPDLNRGLLGLQKHKHGLRWKAHVLPFSLTDAPPYPAPEDPSAPPAPTSEPDKP
jgi:hypothetical protein